MNKLTYYIVPHDGGWAYKVDETFSEPFPTHDAARQAAERAAREQGQPDTATVISYEDSQGHWHKEHAAADDHPHPKVKG